MGFLSHLGHDFSHLGGDFKKAGSDIGRVAQNIGRDAGHAVSWTKSQTVSFDDNFKHEVATLENDLNRAAKTASHGLDDGLVKMGKGVEQYVNSHPKLKHIAEKIGLDASNPHNVSCLAQVNGTSFAEMTYEMGRSMIDKAESCNKYSNHVQKMTCLEQATQEIKQQYGNFGDIMNKCNHTTTIGDFSDVFNNCKPFGNQKECFASVGALSGDFAKEASE